MIPLRSRHGVMAALAATATAAALLTWSAPAPAATRPVTGPVTAPAAAPGALRQAFAAAAKEFGVPEQVLLAVSYLESRWDTNGGQPSVAGGYGPMHLTDLASAVAGRSGLGPGKRPPSAAPGQQTADAAARLTGVTKDRLRADPAQNIRGGAALLAGYQRAVAGAPASAKAGTDARAWYAAVARYSGAAEEAAARHFADEVYATIRAGAERTTADGQYVRLAADPGLRPDTSAVSRLGLRATTAATECPRSLGCEWIPAPYQQNSADPADYGNHDLADRPRSQDIDYVVIHDTETSYDGTIRLVQDPTYVSWQYTLRSADGHVAQHVRHRDVAWQAGNWYINAKSIGLEHEGFLAEGSWYTEAMYRSSAKLVRYITDKYDIPRDRAHILGHDSVPGTLPSTVRGMHEDPGPYWDWAHYFELLGAPLRPAGTPSSGMVMIRPDYATNKVPYTGCDAADPAKLCAEHGGGSVMLRTEPRADAPLVKDIGKHPPDGTATMSVYDHSARASTGTKFAVAGRSGDWTAIWYLGQQAWFHNPASAPTAVPAKGKVVTPKPGLASVPVYGRAYPEAEAYPAGVPVQAVTPLQYTFAAGQRYTVGQSPASEYYFATTFDTSNHAVVRGKTRYLQVQFGHRVMFVKADDVQVVRVG